MAQRTGRGGGEKGVGKDGTGIESGGGGMVSIQNKDKHIEI